MHAKVVVPASCARTMDCKARQAVLRSCNMSLTCRALSCLPYDLGVSNQQVAGLMRD